MSNFGDLLGLKIKPMFVCVKRRQGHATSSIETVACPDGAHRATAESHLDGRDLAYAESDVSDPLVLAEVRERLPRARSIPPISVD